MARSSLREFQERLARRLAEAKTAEHRGLLGFQPCDVKLHVPFDRQLMLENDQVAKA